MSAENDPIVNKKRQLRINTRKQIKRVSIDQLKRISASICRTIAHSNELLNGVRTMAVYAGRNTEIDLAALHSLLTEVRFVYPLSHTKGILTFHSVTSPETMKSGIWDILEPCHNLHEEVAIEDIDLFLCPGLAFDPSGSRIGQGGGYYDRALAKKSVHAEAWGIAMDLQIVDAVDHSDHDQPMNGVITESGIIPATRP